MDTIVKDTHEAMEKLRIQEDSEDTKTMMLNMGPAHPAMHGVIQIKAELDGEMVKGCDIEIGYLHRGFEKECEVGTYTQCFPYTDRLNYVSPLINNFSFALSVETLMGLEVPERCQGIRVIMGEISRICDHLTCVGASAMELGAFTVFLYMIKAREWLWELVEGVTGARLTISYARVGGVKADLTTDFEGRCRKILKDTAEVIEECDALLKRNRIFYDRVKDVGVISAERAMAYGITGPFLRASGVGYDVRKAQPYSGYENYDFDVPVGENGDSYDRYLVRMEEMRQSIRIVEQALDRLPEGPTNVDAQGEPISPELMADLGKFGRTEGLLTNEALLEPTLEGSGRRHQEGIAAKSVDSWLPPKEQTYSNIEALMQHFKIIMDGHGVRPPKGECYVPTEAANGELGFYIVSDGSDHPYRVRCHPPCFPIMAALSEILVGDQVADIIPTFGSVNMIAGELDR
ncbi:MAG TPA: NADH dehydrogenase (quinone) subunit D [Acidobacteriota bacterium]|nr:NADH dehydrogenase (quinone) subunit D [Acidobacteriota bacterium]